MRSNLGVKIVPPPAIQGRTGNAGELEEAGPRRRYCSSSQWQIKE